MPKRRITVPGKGFLEMELPAGAQSSEEMFQPDPMFGGRPTSYQDFPGGGSMEIQKAPSMTPEQPEIPKQLQDRNEYEKFLQSKYGDPWEDERKLPQLIDQITRKDERDLFGHVFGNQFRHEDRRHLDNKARSHWKNALLQYRKQIEGEITTDIESRKDQMGEQMKAFDSYMKEFKEAAAKEPTTQDYKRLSDVYRKISYDKEGNLIEPDPVQIKLFTDMANKLGISVGETDLSAIEGTPGGTWFGFGTESQPAMKALDLTPQMQPETPENNKDQEIIQILKKNGYAATPENIANFKMNNPGL